MDTVNALNSAQFSHLWRGDLKLKISGFTKGCCNTLYGTCEQRARRQTETASNQPNVIVKMDGKTKTGMNNEIVLRSINNGEP